MAATKKTETFFLRYKWNEDEAEMTGYKFVIADNKATISRTFLFDEYAAAHPPVVMGINEARSFWKKCVAGGNFEPASNN